MIQQSLKTIFVILSMSPLCLFAAEPSSRSNNFFTSTQAAPNFKGFYAGIGGGGIIGQFKTNTTTTLSYPSSAFFSNSDNSTNNIGTNGIATLFAGYLYPIKNIVYVGPEVYVNVGKPSFSNSQNANATLPTESLGTSTNAHLNTSEIGIDLRLGGNITPTTLLYGLVGAAFNKISINSSSTISRPAIPLATGVSATSSNNVTGLRLGAGIEQKIFSHFNLRFNYVYTTYPSQNANNATQQNASDPFFQLGPIANITSVKVATHAILLSLIYQFEDGCFSGNRS